MPDWLIALAVGGGTVLASQILSFIIHRSLISSREDALARANKREDDHEKREQLLITERDHAHENERILNENQGKLLAELAALKTKHNSLVARAAAAEASVDDLSRLLEEHPGALADAVRAAAIRLRKQLSASGEAASAPATRDPDRPDDRAVHGGSDALEDPRS